LSAGRAAAAAQAAEERFGPWRVIETLGEGASGRVLLARRGELEDGRLVAIKTLRSPSPTALARFELERQALARLEHPNIARLYDAGKNAAGVPYVVLEHVDGLPIDVYCDLHGLAVEARLRLFLEVCRGVQHAHRNLIVHRDLKPANILVDPEGRPRLLDFGIARLLDLPASGDSTPSATGWAEATARTPAYASPEQILGKPITTAADVFSLGIVLYELLAGRSPWGPRTSRHQLEKAICEEDPEPASKAARLAGEGPAARRGGAGSRRLAGRLRGELDAILATALARRPADRYASVEALARDLENHLAHLPLEARPPGFFHGLRLLLRRHTGAALAAAVLLAALAAFLLVLAGQARVLSAERDKAAQALAFLIEVFRAGEPGFGAGSTAAAGDADQLTARQVMGRAAQRVVAELAAQPEAQATLLGAIGEVNFSLGLYREAARLQQLALSRRIALGQGDNLETALTRYHMAEALVMAGEPAQAEEQYRLALETRRRELPADAPELIENLIGLATALEVQDAMKEAIAYRREVADLTADAEVGRRLLILGTLAAALHNDRQYEAGDLVNQEAWELASRTRDIESVDFAEGLFEVGVALSYDYDPRSLPIFLRSLEIRRRLLPPEHPRLLESEQTVAVALLDQQEWSEALALLERVIAGKYRQLGRDHFLVLSAELQKAICLGELGDWDAAAAIGESVLARAEATDKPLSDLSYVLTYLSAFERRRKNLDAAWRYLLRAEKCLLDARAERAALVELQLRQASLEADFGRLELARKRFELLIGEMKTRFPQGDWRVSFAEADYARVLALAGRDAEAEKIARRSYADLADHFGDRSRHLRPALHALAQVYRTRGDRTELARIEGWLADPRLRPTRIGAAP
jgi:eukaryotic-like serine/threonine-protein kinase